MSMDTFCEMIKEAALVAAKTTREEMLKTMFKEDEE